MKILTRSRVQHLNPHGEGKSTSIFTPIRAWRRPLRNPCLSQSQISYYRSEKSVASKQPPKFSEVLYVLDHQHFLDEARGDRCAKDGAPLAKFSSTAHKLELLHPAAVDGLTDIDVALGVERHCVSMHEFADLVARAAKAAQHLPTGAIHDVDLLVDFVDDVHELLGWITGKFDGGSRAHQHRFPP